MAAYFKTTKRNFTWYVGFPPFNSVEEIKDVLSVQIDGHEAEFLYGLGLDLKEKYVHTLEGNEAKLYVRLIHEMFRAKSVEECALELNNAVKRITNGN